MKGENGGNTREVGRWIRLTTALAMGAAVAVASVAGCSSAETRSDSATSTQPSALRGLYEATAAGPIGDLAISDDGGYVLRPSACHTSACLETGRATLDARAKKLVLEGAGGAPSHAFAVEVLATTSRPATPSSVLTPKTELTSSSSSGSLVGADSGALVEAGASTNDGSADVLDTIESATIDGQPVALVMRGTMVDGGPTANDASPPYPGSIPGTGPLRAPSNGETTTVHPGGGSVTVASPGDPAFATDPQLAARYAGVANVYNSHGMPGMLMGGIPADTVRDFLRSDQPLIVAACFSGASMSGGSAIRRLVSAYGDDPSVASRVYGCTGWAAPVGSSGLACTGVWVDANNRAVPLVERQRLSLGQLQCRRNVVVNGVPDFSDCVAAN